MITIQAPILGLLVSYVCALWASRGYQLLGVQGQHDNRAYSRIARDTQDTQHSPGMLLDLLDSETLLGVDHQDLGDQILALL